MRTHSIAFVLIAARRRLADERGWALLETVASTVVVVMAFVGTTMAWNGSTASVARDQKKTQAMIVAQNEINRLRGIGLRSITELLSYNTAPKNEATITHRGVEYSVSYKAYYVTGIGGDEASACDTAYSDTNSTARYIYIRVNVNYPGQTLGSSNATSSVARRPTSLDTYYSPEGGGAIADTGTLRVYVLDRNDVPVSDVSTVRLRIAGETTDYVTPSPTINPATGCVLFTGLARNTYQIQVPGTSKQNIFMTNRTNTSYVYEKVIMPDRGALSRVIRIEAPLRVQPVFKAKFTNGNDQTVTTTSASTANPFVFGGPWVAQSDAITTNLSPDFALLPGRVHMPLTAQYMSDATHMFPAKAGYSAFAGPCTANDPDNDLGVAEYVPVPTTSTDPGWVPGASNPYVPELWLQQLRAQPSLAALITARPSTGLTANSVYYWSQTWTTAKVKVRLVSDVTGQVASGDCKPATNLFNTWQQLPGSISTSGGLLGENAMALPAGKYDVCVRLNYTYSYQKRNSTNSGWLTTAGNVGTNVNGTSYLESAGLSLAHKTPIAQAYNFSPPNSTTQISSSAVADCDGGSGTWT